MYFALLNKLNVFWKIFIPFVVLSSISICAFLYMSTRAVDDLNTSYVLSNMQSSARLMSDEFSRQRNLSSASKICQNLADVSKARVSLIGRDGKVLFDSQADEDSMDNHANRPEIRLALLGRMSFKSRYSQTLGKRMLYSAVPVLDANTGEINYVIRLATNAQDLVVVKNKVIFDLMILSVFILIMSTLIAIFVGKSVSKPLKILNEASFNYSKGNFGYKMENIMSVDFHNLADSMCHMADELDEKIKILDSKNKELSEIFLHMQECILICQKDGSILNSNKAMQDTFDIDEASKDKSIFEKIRNFKFTEIFFDQTQNGKSKSQIIDFDNLKNFSETVSMYVVVIDFSERVLVVFTNISQLRQLEKMRKEFVDGVSHELKTPITTIKGFVETLKDVEDKKSKDRFLNIIDEQVDRLNSLVDDMLLLSQIEYTFIQQSADFIEINLSKYIDEVLVSSGFQLKNADISLKIDCPKDLVILAHSSMRLVFSNLINNAIKYSDEHGKLSVEVFKDDEFLNFRVSDTGMGISKEHISRIFDRFYRVDKGRARAKGGTGLGLSIVKNVVQLHKGKIEVESVLNKGSTFTVKLPNSIIV